MNKWVIILIVLIAAGGSGYWWYTRDIDPETGCRILAKDRLFCLDWANPLPTQEIVVYFSRSEPTDIVQVAVKRTIIKTSKVATAAIEKLLEGPTEEEKAQGLTTAINSGTKLNYVQIENGVATVDFNDRFDYQMGGSARVRAIYQQIYKTLTQFSTVKEIKITINHGARPANLEP